MQKLICTILASTASAGELFLAQKPSLDQDLINTKLDIDIKPDNILPCQYFTQTAVFNFQNVLDPTKVGSPTDTLQEINYPFANGAKLSFNWCEDPFAASTQSSFLGTNCPTSKSNAFIATTDTDCAAFNPVDDNATGDTAGFEIMDTEGTVQGVSLIYSGGVCGDGVYNLNVTAMCPKDGKDNKQPPIVTDHFVTGTCNYTIVYETQNGCAVFSLSQVSRFFYKYSYLFGAVLIAAGFFLAFLGNKFVNVVIFLVSSFALMIIGASLFINLALEKVDEEWVVWTAFVVILLVSMGVGLLLVKFRKYGIGLFAGWGGVMLGFVVTTTFAVANQYAFYAIIIAAAIGMFLIAIKVEKSVIILLTAFIGSYAFVRGISLYAGGFPSETELHDELEAGIITWETMPKTYYGYLGGIVVVFMISAVYQFKHNQKKEKDRAQLKTFMK